MQIEIREEIAGFESEELLLHAPFVQRATPQDAFAQSPCRLRIKVAQSPILQANSATAFFTTVLSPQQVARALNQHQKRKKRFKPDTALQ
jgi:hypothetical protein